MTRISFSNETIETFDSFNEGGTFQICVYDKDGIEQEPCVDSVEATVGGRPAKLSIEDGKLIAR